MGGEKGNRKGRGVETVQIHGTMLVVIVSTLQWVDVSKVLKDTANNGHRKAYKPVLLGMVTLLIFTTTLYILLLSNKG